MMQRTTVLWVVALLGSLSAGPSAGDKPTAFTDPEKAGPDFAVQGEYAGEIQTSEGPVKFGAQLIALGKGEFHGVFYRGGLPGDGWDREGKLEADSQVLDGTITFKGERGSARLRDGALAIYNREERHIGDLKKVIRQSPTLGAKPPKDAVVLFDGDTAEHFEGGRLADDGWLMPGVVSKRKFQDFTVHLEFRTPFTPEARGQPRGNSGCYLQGRYEVQILDSFGLEGKNHECGGLYEIKDPDLNICFPPLSWQTYDIDYTAARYDAAGQKTRNARVTVRHNGVVIHQDAELPRATRANRVPEGPEPGPIYLQDHGDPVRFRNVWVVERT